MPTCDQAPSAHLAGAGSVASLEHKLATWYGLPHALAVSNATSGLLGIALALDLAGAEFITTPYTWGGSLASWLAIGCRPVFADIDPRTLTLDPASVRERLTPGTRAILAVDINGTPCDTAALRRIADEHGLWLIVDAAQSLGATREGRPSGVDADAVVVSFGSGKVLNASEGGAVLTSQLWLHQRLVWHTQHPERQARDVGLGLVNEFALNARIHPVAADLALARFDAAFDEVRQRQAWAFAMLDHLRAHALIAPVDWLRHADILPSFHRIAVQTTTSDAATQPLTTCLAAGGFRARVERSPVNVLYEMPSFPLPRESVVRCPIAEAQSRRQLQVSRLD